MSEKKKEWRKKFGRCSTSRRRITFSYVSLARVEGKSLRGEGKGEKRRGATCSASSFAAHQKKRACLLLSCNEKRIGAGKDEGKKKE